MKYKESKRIFKKLLSSKKVLINCHAGPDADSIGSALALQEFLKNKKILSEVVCPEPYEIPEEFSFLRNISKIKTTNLKKIDFTKYDLFLIIDTSSYKQVFGTSDYLVPNIEKIVIDHHESNDIDTKYKLIDTKSPATSQIIYHFLKDNNLEISKEIAAFLLTGIIGDTGGFLFPNTTPDTLKTAAELMEIGADKNKIIHNLFQSIPFKRAVLASELTRTATLDNKHKLVWTKMDYETYKSFGADREAKGLAASLFFQQIKNTDVGLMIVEVEPKKISVSFRARRFGFDTAKIAKELGGGGHKVASGATVEGMDFEKAVNSILKTTRKHLK